MARDEPRFFSNRFFLFLNTLFLTTLQGYNFARWYTWSQTQDAVVEAAK